VQQTAAFSASIVELGEVWSHLFADDKHIAGERWARNSFLPGIGRVASGNCRIDSSNPDSSNRLLLPDRDHPKVAVQRAPRLRLFLRSEVLRFRDVLQATH
jgi:hypothetical protein